MGAGRLIKLFDAARDSREVGDIRERPQTAGDHPLGIDEAAWG